MRSANKVAINTGVLYARMLITMGISLYTTKVVLNALGSTDFGIFNLVAGVITMLSFLNSAMTTSTQRFLSFFQGKRDIAMQKKVFTNSLILHLGIGLIIVVGLEIVGFFLFNGFLSIPMIRLDAAKTIYQFMSITVFFTIIAVPFNGSLTAHENMLWIAIVNVVETLLKLAIAIVLLRVNSDKLVLYGILTSAISLISLILYAGYCLKKYDECTLRNITQVDRELITKLTSFAGWNLFGSLCGLGRSQGLAIMLNLFFGTIVNAAYGIANQVSAQLNFLSATMLRAINPQIMKSEGAGDRQRMLKLSMIASKLGYFLLAIVAIPCIFEMDTILKIWLKNVPEYTVSFCQLVLLGALINQLTIGLQSAIQATGRIKLYQSVVGTIIFFNIPIAYFLLKWHYPAQAVLISYCTIELIACAFRMYFLKTQVGLSIREYCYRVFIKELFPSIVIVSSCIAISHFIYSDYRFIYTFSISMLLFMVSIYFTGLCDDEKNMLIQITLKIKNKFISVPGVI